jgi:spore coat protein U-like protein
VNKVIFILLLFSTLSSTLLRAEDGVFYIGGNAVKAISMSLGVSAIDFGDVYSDSEVDSEMVDFSVNAENGYDYTVEISNDDSSGVVQLSRNANAGYTAGSITYIETATGADQRHEFYVDLNTASMSGDLSATITVLVAYNDIPE